MSLEPRQQIRDVLAEGDELIEVTSFGGPIEFLVGQKATGKAEAIARAHYLADRITIEDFEAALDEIYAPVTSDPDATLRPG